MKKASAARLALAFTGSFLGAGYVSGQELWQFFGRFGIGAVPGVMMAMAIIALLGYAAMELARRTGIAEMDRLVVQRDVPLLRSAVTVLQTVILFGVTVIMCAGAAALCRQQWGISEAVSGTVFAAAVGAVSLLGITGLVDVFSALVPLLSAAVVLVGGAAVFRGGIVLPEPAASVGGWTWSAVVFCGYNLFGVIGVLIPLGQMAEDAKTNRRVAALGSFLLAVIAGSVMAAVFSVPGAIEAELPILIVLECFAPWATVIFAALLLAVMFGASLGCIVALQTFLQEKFSTFRRRKGICTGVIMTAALAGSFAGFGRLISTVYPIFGYCGIGFLVLLALHWMNVRKE